MSMHSPEVASLRRENEQLRDKLTVLEESVGAGLQAPRLLCLSKMQERVFCCLYRRGFAERDTIMAAMYGVEVYEKDPKSLDVYICSLRKKCAPHGITIKMIYGRGYEMPEESRRIVSSFFSIEN
jgi:two-component system cell cycle response regulator CtrA